MLDNRDVFDPVLLSFEDCDFLLSHAGEAPIVARKSVPAACNRTVMDWIERFYELDELQRAGRGSWKGPLAVKTAIQTYLDQREKWAREEKLGAPPFPSLYAFDSRGKAHFQGPGSDSGRVRTYFDAEGKRIPFAINLVTEGTQGWTPDWINKKEVPAVDAVIEDPDKAIFTCSICSKTETFRTDSRASRAAARARMSKHLRNAEKEKERHLELHTLEFGS
jgi:hypothetical protein